MTPHRSIVASWFVLVCLGAAVSRAADPPAPPAGRVRGVAAPVTPTGHVLTVGDGKLVVTPLPQAKAGGAAAPPPADQTLSIDKERTRVSVEVVTDERTTATGQRLRASQFEAGEVEDLEPGQRVRVTSRDGVATAVAILVEPDAPLPPPATVVKVDEKSITVVAAQADGAAGAAERTYSTDPQKTKVTLVRVVAEREFTPGEKVRVLNARPGTLADVKAGHLVRVRARKDLAVAVRVVPAEATAGGQ
jgi:hypothetical protein